jgi:hypothetical protein
MYVWMGLEGVTEAPAHRCLLDLGITSARGRGVSTEKERKVPSSRRRSEARGHGSTISDPLTPNRVP